MLAGSGMAGEGPALDTHPEGFLHKSGSTEAAVPAGSGMAGGDQPWTPTQPGPLVQPGLGLLGFHVLQDEYQTAAPSVRWG